MTDKMRFITFIWVALNLLPLICGCNQATKQAGFTTPIAAVIPPPSETQEEVERTNIAQPSATPTSFPTIKPTRTPTLTLTPLPTLSFSEARRLVYDYTRNNGGCRLPCWWGITPGETTWQEAYQFLSTFATVKEDGIFRYKFSDTVRGGGYFVFRDSSIFIIYIGPRSTSYLFQLHQILTEYGRPDKILMRTFSGAPEPYLPFTLALFYSEQRFMVVYDFEARKSGDLLLGCPRGIAPELWVWSQYEVWTEERIQEEVLGFDPTVLLQPLDQVTDMDIVSFYQIFKDPNNNQCIETLAELW